MRIIHCADVHLDSALSANLTPEKAKERKNELLMTFIKMVEYACDNHVKAIIIAGDLFDKKVIGARIRKTIYDVIVQNAQIDFYYLQGNHDTSSFIGWMENIPANLFLFSDKWQTYELCRTNDRAITLTGVELDKDNSNSIYASLVLQPQDFNIVTLHGQIMHYQNKDKAEVIDLNALRNKNISYLALGHIHEYQEGSLPPGGIYCYPGCLEGRGYDEPGQHGFVLLDINEDNMQMDRSFVPFARRLIHVLNVDVSDCETSNQMVDKIRREIGDRRFENDMVKIILLGDVDVDCDRDIDFISKNFEGEFYSYKISDQTSTRIDYREYVNDKSLKGEFIRLIENDQDLTEEDRIAIIRCGLQVLRREGIEI